MNDDLRRELVALLNRIVGDRPVPAELQPTVLRMLAGLMPEVASAEVSTLTAAAAVPPAATASGAGNRRLVYVHGICRHGQGFSDSWWDALHPFVLSAFGAGQLGQSRLEVIWSDLVNVAAANLAAAAQSASSATAGSAATAAVPPLAAPSEATATQASCQQAAAEIKEALRDRGDQQMLGASAAMLGAALGADGAAGVPQAADSTAGLISIPGANCIDDFATYLIDDGIRQSIINRFIAVVRPELQAGRELDVIAHSWGTVVAYEALRQMEGEGDVSPRIRNLFTVGAALSIGPVKTRLRPTNQDGRKPASVRRWVNLDARGDVVGGPLKGRPYAVDLDFLNLNPFGCGSFLGIVSPQCAHSSYFAAGNTAVNRDIFARFIDLL